MKSQKRATKPVHLLTVGSFGQSVGAHLRLLRDDLEVTEVNGNTIPLPETWPESRMNALATWRPVPALCELLDQLSYEGNKPFVPLILDATVLRLGPIVSPPRGSCWNCWTRRCQQHASWPKEQSALLQHYATHPGSGPQGYLEPFAMMGAAKICEAIDGLDAMTTILAHIWQLDMITRSVTTGTVVGIHDCPRCGLHRPPATRTFAEMQHSLAYLWTNPVRETP